MKFSDIQVGSGFQFTGDRPMVKWEKTAQTDHVLVGPCPKCGEPGTNAVSGGFSTHICPNEEVEQL